ncbi:hypothetical protein [Brachyspira sp. SAP_772]|uniref:hypothetical protein n=1 Tax=Brachyspira sp. SAP_772 TaxID=2608385 RepID=UPI0012F4C467|nr:hypothetical protein [Brachyspira sp. SAP_772]
MKKLQIILILLITVSLLFTSCAKRYSATNPESGSLDSGNSNPPSNIEGDENVPQEEDPFENGEWNDINYKFDGNKISEFLFGVSFNESNVPTYKFYKKDPKKWELKNSLTSEYYFDGTDDENKAQTYAINPAIFYRYDFKNPLVDSMGSYNQSTKMKRFLFYRLEGNTEFFTINNYLIAIDTHSKLVFAYAKITKTESGQQYATESKPVEEYGEKRKFYEYDPIGFISYNQTEDSLTLTLYEEYKEEMIMNAKNYFPQVHDANRNVAGYDDANSAGRSPYYIEQEIGNIDPQTIIDQLKGKTYSIREGLDLYTYKFSDDGKKVTFTVNNFYDGETVNNELSYSEVVGTTSLKYGDVTITGIGAYDIIKDANREYIIDYQDNGPDFIYRVAGKTFKNSSENRTYEFSDDGTSLTYTENGKVETYNFAEQSSDSKAAYSKAENVFWGLRLSEHNGKKDGRISASANYANVDTTTAMAGELNDYEAFIDDTTTPSKFVSTVGGKTYFYRDYTQPDSGNGKSLNANKYIFNENATVLTYTEMVYKQEDVSTTYNLVSVNGTKATYSSNGKNIIISLGTDSNMIYDENSNSLGDYTAEDKGPFFLDIVRGNEYIAEDKSYKYNFSSDGKLLTFTYASGETIKYDYSKTDSEYFKAAYKQQDTLFPRYWALRVTSQGNTLEMSTGSLAAADHILRDGAYGWKALFGSGSLIEDSFLNAVAGKVFAMRNTSDSTKLERYTFSSGGATLTYEQIDWYTDQVVSTSKIEFYGYEKVNDTRGKYKYNDSNDQIVIVEFSIDSLSPIALSKANSVVGYYNYQDPGPYIYDVVKGKTYKRPNGDTYKFDSTGKVVEYYVNGKLDTTYDFSKVKSGNHLLSAYKDREKLLGFSRYWGVKVENKDVNLYVSTGSLATADHIINSGDYGDPYILQK